MTKAEADRSFRRTPQQLRRRRLMHAITIALLSLLVLSLGGCQSPTLPLPPPSRPDVSAPDASGMIRISGRINAYSIVLAENARTNEIAGKETGDEGRYTIEMNAEVNDVIEIWEIYKTQQSERVIVVVPDDDAPGGAGAAGL